MLVQIFCWKIKFIKVFYVVEEEEKMGEDFCVLKIFEDLENLLQEVLFLGMKTQNIMDLFLEESGEFFCLKILPSNS